MKRDRCLLSLLLLGVCLGSIRSAQAQAVAVTARFDTNRVAVGDSTLLRVFAQVVPAQRPNADQIFSWYVDLLNTNGTIAAGTYASLTKPESDNDPSTSSSGTTQGANRRGIYDTFLSLPRAGVTTAVELIRVPVVGQAVGNTRFLVQAGTGVPNLSLDFLVAPTGGGGPLIGGDYSAAFADLQVLAGTACNPSLTLTLAPSRTTGTITFTPCPGRTHYVQGLTDLGDPASWQSLPGGPHNSGSVPITLGPGYRFFRLRVTTP